MDAPRLVCRTPSPANQLPSPPITPTKAKSGAGVYEAGANWLVARATAAITETLLWQIFEEKLSAVMTEGGSIVLSYPRLLPGGIRVDVKATLTDNNVGAELEWYRVETVGPPPYQP